MGLRNWLMIGVIGIAAGCSADPKGTEWPVGEPNGQPNNTSELNNAVDPNNGPGTNSGTNGPGTNNELPPDPRPTPRGGAAEGEGCESTINCAEGLECAETAEFEEPSQLRCTAPECFCESPETTFCLNGDCALADRNCVLDGCPDDFACEGKVCICNGLSCEGACRGDDHCNWDEVCVEGACRDARCEADDECPARYVCGAGQNDRLCRVGGTIDVGGDCSRDTECKSGYCYDSVTCVQPCMANTECGERECATPTHFDLAVPYCQAPRCGDCASGQYCRENTCDTDPCPGGACDWNDI